MFCTVPGCRPGRAARPRCSPARLITHTDGVGQSPCYCQLGYYVNSELDPHTDAPELLHGLLHERAAHLHVPAKRTSYEPGPILTSMHHITHLMSPGSLSALAPSASTSLAVSSASWCSSRYARAMAVAPFRTHKRTPLVHQPKVDQHIVFLNIYPP